MQQDNKCNVGCSAGATYIFYYNIIAESPFFGHKKLDFQFLESIFAHHRI